MAASWDRLPFGASFPWAGQPAPYLGWTFSTKKRKRPSGRYTIGCDRTGRQPTVEP